MKPGEIISLFPSNSSDLICEEKKVLASPTEDDFASSTSNEDYSKLNSGMNSLQGVSRDVHKHNIMLHDTPPTTPSTESLLSSSPSNETDSFPINYTESSRSGEGEPDLSHYDSNKISINREEAAAILTFDIPKLIIFENPNEDASEANIHRESLSLSKRNRRKLQKYLKIVKSSKLKSSYSCLKKDLTGPEKKIAELEDNMAVMRMQFKLLRAEVKACDRYKAKKARKKVRKADPSVKSEDGPSCSY